LTEALRLRESLGDWEGAAITRHNLNLLGGFGGDRGPEGNGTGGAGTPVPWLPIIGAIVVVAIMTLVGAALSEGKWNPFSGNETPQGEEQPGGGGGGEKQPEGGEQPGGAGGDGTQPPVSDEYGDGDGDGVPDAEDSCPDATNIGSDFDQDGIDDACDPPPSDPDGDGVLGAQDKCPTEPAETPNGCPIVVE
jgi:hypothetical protein